MKYTVKKGDTLSAIATKHKTTVKDIQKLNPTIINANKIKVGQVITLPDNKTDGIEALKKCLNAIENLTEFKALLKLL